MTKRFNVHHTCPHCGGQSTAETSFGRWMRGNRELDSGLGIVRTDCDHIVCRYKTHTDGRNFQLMMVVEVKEHGAEPDPAQRDILSFLHQSMVEKEKNRYNARTCRSIRMKSTILNRHVLVRNFGVFLLQFENTSPADSSWIKWNRRIIDEKTLTEILAMNRRPDNPDLLMDDYLRDRHKKKEQLELLM
jgi:hypothetical protein